MSFILDALRKSEHERRMETAPDIMHTPVAVTREQLPMWAIALIGALAAALLAVGVYSIWQRYADAETATTQGRPVPPARTGFEAEPPAAQESVQAGASATPTIQDSRVAPPPAVDQPATDSITVESTPVEAVRAAPPPSIAEPVATSTSTPSVPARLPRAAQRERLPNYTDLLADGMNVGALQMQLHVHSSTPANRFVVINGSRRREGDRFSDGLVIEEIVPEGAILSYQGRSFLLPPN